MPEKERFRPFDGEKKDDSPWILIGLRSDQLSLFANCKICSPIGHEQNLKFAMPG